VGHSKELTNIRDEITRDTFSQYNAQGFEEPIENLISVEFVFYVLRQHEPDVDNLPAIVLDALQGKKAIRKGEKVKLMKVLSDDKLVRFITAEKIVKGDPKYVGDPRTEFTIRRYSGCDNGEASRALQVCAEGFDSSPSSTL